MARRRVLLGGFVWIAVGQYFLVNVLVASRWSDPSYNPLRDTISSLGETSARSPWHDAANVSWVVTGVAMLIGAVLTAPAFPQDRTARAGLRLLRANGVGLAIVGLNPDDLRIGLHVVGAAVSLVGGNVALILLGLSLRRAGQWRLLGSVSLICGVAGLLALLLMQVGGTGSRGLFERIAADPVVAWYVVCGIVIVRAAPTHAAVHA
jgi:hypothetical membrane protein